MQPHGITLALVCYTAVFGVVTQRTKNGCVADYSCTGTKTIPDRASVHT